MKRLNGGNVPKIQLTREEWFLAAMPMRMPKGSQVDFMRLAPEDYVPMPIKATEQGVRDVLGYISLAADVYEGLGSNPNVDQEVADGAWGQLRNLDAMGARLVRMAGFDFDTFIDTGELTQTAGEQAA